MKVFYLLALVFCTACSSSQEITEAKTISRIDAKPVIVDMSFEKKTDPYVITSAHVKGQQLVIDIEYVGGCKGHVFELYTNGFIMKSLPPKQSFFLRHFANEDYCEVVKVDQLVFDLSKTASAGNTLVLLLENYEGDLRMDF